MAARSGVRTLNDMTIEQKSKTYICVSWAVVLSLALVHAQTGLPVNPPTTQSPEEFSAVKAKAEAGDAQAQYVLGMAYRDGNGVLENDELAVRWYRKAAEQGNASAQNALGVVYGLGRGVEKDPAEAVRWYRQAAKQGNDAAMFNLGASYYNGQGVPTDLVQAYAWFVSAEHAGNAPAKEAVTRMKSELKFDREVVEGMLAVARKYASGQDIPANMPEAIVWYRKAADAGFSAAAWDLSKMYAEGKGVTKDPAEASLWRQKAIAAEYAPALFETGLALWKGEGVSQNRSEAAQWFARAARQGYAPAMQNLAVMYGSGDGVQKDLITSYMWFLLADLNGSPTAKPGIEMISKELTPKQIEKARERARQFHFAGASRPTLKVHH